MHSVRRHYGVRTERYKLIHYYNLGEWELFDVETDPDELANLYDDSTHGDVLAELKAELVRLRELYTVPEIDPDVEAELNPLQESSGSDLRGSLQALRELRN